MTLGKSDARRKINEPNKPLTQAVWQSLEITRRQVKESRKQNSEQRLR